MTIKEMREKRAALYKSIKELADKLTAESRDFSPEEQANWDQLNKDYDALTRRIDVAERSARIGAEQAAPADRGALPGRDDTAAEHRDRALGVDRADAPTDEDRALSLQAWLRQQAGLPLKKAHLEACRRTGMRPSLRTLRLALNRQAPRSLAEARNMSLTVGAGGYTIPVGFVRNLELALLAFGGVRQVAEILRTDGYAAMPWPTADDTGNKGALLAEATTIGSSVDPTISEVVFNAYKFSSKLVKVSAELLQDSAFNLADILGSMLGERIGRIENDYQTTGSGNDQPNGIVTAAATGVTTASATAIAADELIDLVHSVDPAYRPGAAFMMHDSVIKALRKLKDGEGRYLWVSGLATGMADSLLGYPIVPNQSMASSIAHLAKTVLFGQFSKYKIREVATIRLRRLVERYADTDEEGFVAFTRMDSDLLDAGTHPVKLLVQV